MIDIDKLEAGPELDALVAEKVMGWEREFSIRDAMCRGLPSLGFPPGSSDERKTISGYGYWKSEFNGGKPVPQYSTDIAAAWEVVEKMRANWKGGTREGLEVWSRFSNALWRMFCPWGAGDETDAWDVCLRSIDPLAICRAALKAVGA